MNIFASNTDVNCLRDASRSAKPKGVALNRSLVDTSDVTLRTWLFDAQKILAKHNALGRLSALAKSNGLPYKA